MHPLHTLWLTFNGKVRQKLMHIEYSLLGFLPIRYEDWRRTFEDLMSWSVVGRVVWFQDLSKSLQKTQLH